MKHAAVEAAPPARRPVFLQPSGIRWRFSTFIAGVTAAVIVFGTLAVLVRSYNDPILPSLAMTVTSKRVARPMAPSPNPAAHALAAGDEMQAGDFFLP